MGATNSVLYIIGYLQERLYGTSLSAAFGIIIQISSFFLWKKNAYKQATKFRKFAWKGRTVLAVGLLVSWATTSLVLWQMGGSEVVLDGLITVLGFLLPILQMFAIIESLPLALLNNLISLTLWVRIVFVGGAIANTTYVISSLYGLYMTTRMVFRWLSLYKEQNAPSATTEEQEILQEQL